MTTQWTGPEDPAETARWEAEKAADRCPVSCDDDCTAECHEDHLPRYKREGCFICTVLEHKAEQDALQMEPAPTDTSWIRMEPIRGELHRHARRTDAAGIALTSFIAGSACALGVVWLVAAALRALGAR